MVFPGLRVFSADTRKVPGESVTWFQASWCLGRQQREGFAGVGSGADCLGEGPSPLFDLLCNCGHLVSHLKITSTS